ncbi:nucleobase:cation symporter-2 family protein [Candidatus Formimonas warabiya]|uniref:Xanthine permease n=1 Tax=Formimonas warabiya TaxID=1761012 RepID=A0A3G1L1D5_FORW1|nr:nucleobase:cation symporter-2 family protein [Candidatus Formimonas warabiya]ATW28477.1 xanthine permease [Candidatus Formimonas warabiya]
MADEKVDRVNQMLPVSKLSILGLQHVLAFYAGGIAIPLIIGGSIGLSQEQIALLVAADLFTCGIATLIQTIGIKGFAGIQLPVVLGCAFAPVAVMISIGNSIGITAIYGSIIGAAIFMILVAPFFGKVLRYFPPIVTGSVVTIVGLTLIPVGINDIAGGSGSPTFGDPKNLLLALFTLLVILAVNRFFKGFIQSISILIGLFVGTIVSGFFGMVDLSVVANAKWLSFVSPFAFGVPSFDLRAILTMSVTMIVVMIESTGTFLVVGKFCDKEITEKDVVKGLRAEGIGSILGGVFNSFPYTTYSGNAGLVGLTKVGSRFVVVAAGIILVVLGLIPKFAALATVIPMPVLGAAMMMMFAMVAMAGVEIMQKVDFSYQGNLLIAACSIGIGLGITVVPALFSKTPELVQILIGQNGIVLGSATAVLLNIIFNHEKNHVEVGDTGYVLKKV